MASSIRPLHPFLHQNLLRFSPHLPFQLPMSSNLCTVNPLLRSQFRCTFKNTIATESSEKMSAEESKKKGKSHLRLRLAHQVEFGERVAVVGSAKELGSWKKKIPMEWTESGWVCEIDLRGCKFLEFKFVILRNGGKGIIWEEGENRAVEFPNCGVYDLVCGWNKTREVLDLLGGVYEEEVDGEGDGDGLNLEDDGVVKEVDGSVFVEQWQGNDVSFMRLNEHRNREIERRWEIEGLDGLALKLVEGDKTARNWWRKV